MNALVNTLWNASRPSFMPVMAQKIMVRISKRDPVLKRAEALAWCASRAEEVTGYAEAIDPVLWREAEAFAERDDIRAQAILNRLGVRLGGSAHTALLYFLVRQRRPETVVETGVAAGFSTQALLAGLDANGTGTLHSSDFPYFRLVRPERFVGAVVEERLKSRWQLHVKGDRQNLDVILARCGRIGLFHYDSDKSYAGRIFALGRIETRLADDAVIVMDDIDGNSFFRDFVERTGARAHIFRHGCRYVGLIDGAEN